MGKSLNQAKANAIRYTKKKVEHWQLVSLALAGYDAISIIIAFFLALWFRFDCRYSMIPKEFLGAYLKFIGIYVIFSLFVFWRLRLYNSIWRFASYSELVRMIVATGISSLFHCTGMTLFLGRMPLSYYFFGTVIQFGMMLMVRFAYRFVLLERSKRRKTEEIAKAKRVLLIGGGKAGQIILRDILVMNSVSSDMTVNISEMILKQGLADVLKYALIVVSSAPLLMVYPFIQKHFVKGVMMGSMKG